jgi:hypothetical protein
MKVGTRVQMRAPVVYVGRYGTIVRIRKYPFLHPMTKYVVLVDDGTTVTTGAVRKITTNYKETIKS